MMYRMTDFENDTNNSEGLRGNADTDPLQDYLPLTEVRTVSDAEHLVSVLDAAGIPAVMQGAGTTAINVISSASPRVCVPRHLLRRANEVLEDLHRPADAEILHREPKSSVRKSAETLAIGIEWLFYPWFFLARERLSFSLFEFWLTTLMCGASIGFIIRGFARVHAPFWLYVFVMYIIIHCYCVALLGAVYELRKREKKSALSGAQRLILIITFQAPLLAAFAATGLLLQSR